MATMTESTLFKEVAEEYENTEEVDLEGEAKARTPDEPGARGMASFGTDLYVTLYQFVDRERRIVRESTIQRSHEQKKIDLRDGRGRRVFYRESELPQGWRLENPRDAATHRCPVQGCPKLLPSAKALRDHMVGFHPRQYDDIFKEEVNALVKAEMQQNGVFDSMVIKRGGEGADGEAKPSRKRP